MEYKKEYHEVVATDGEIDLVREIDADDLYFDIALHNTNTVIGEISYEDKYRDTDYMGNVGYSIFSNYRGNEYASKALFLLKEILIKEGKEKMILSIYPYNKASQKTAKNLGANLICYRQIPKDHVLYKEAKEGQVMIYTYNLKGGKTK